MSKFELYISNMNMRLKFIAAALAAMLAGGWLSDAGAAVRTTEFKQAENLYRQGLYSEARVLFEDIAARESDSMTDGYIVLCALQEQSDGFETMLREYESRYINSTLSPQINFLYGNILFDKGEYDSAAERFASVPEIALTSQERTEKTFKQAYCDFGSNNLEQAAAKFRKIEKMPYSAYTAPTRYALGYIDYNDKRFEDAYDWFEMVLGDERFALNARYYMLECRFMLHDYKYVEENGEKVYVESSDERKAHLSRILSESYLVMGNAGKAKEYYDRNLGSKPNMNRSDYFYAGSLQYALGNYAGAIENYSLMTMRADSLGQIANYQMGYSYIQTKDKVQALKSFEQAASVDFDEKIREDAFFNYAKLAFDINRDTAPFKEYLSVFPHSGKQDTFYNYMAQKSLAEHDYAAAVEAFDNIDNLDDSMKGNYMKANYLRAQQLISNGAYSDAVSSLRAATFFSDKQDNFNKLARYWLGQAYYYSENYNAAVDTFTDLYNNSALDTKDEGRLLPYDLAYAYFQKGDYQNAAKWFDKYISSRDAQSRQDAMVRRADCDFLRKDYKNAVNSYQKVIAEFPDPNTVYPYYQMGLANGLAGSNAAKIKALSTVLDASPDSPFYSEALYELGRSYVTSSNDEKALECFTRLRETSRDKTFAARALIEMGMIFRNRTDYDQALRYYKEVVEEMPGSGSSEDALLAIESIYQAKGEPDNYISYMNSLNNPSLKMSESETEMVYFNSAEQLFLTGNYEKAITTLERYLSQYPQGSRRYQACYYMADSYKALGRKEKALDYYRKVADSGASDSFTEAAILSYSNICYELERFNDAFESYTSLLSVAKLENNQKTARTGMMRSAYKAKNYSAVISCADEVLGTYSDAALLREAEYLKAKAYLESSQREKAYDLFGKLAASPATDEGAEATYLLIQDSYDRGNFAEVPDKVYKFAKDAPDQGYWLAKSYIVLGDSFAEQENYRQARVTFESVANGYTPAPGKTSDDVTETVRMRLEKLNELTK